MLSATNVLDKEVIDSKGWKIGKVKDILFDENQWQVSAIDIELEGNVADEFEIGKRFHKTRLPVDVRSIQAVAGDRVLLKASKEELFNLVAMSQGGTPSTPPTSNAGTAA